MQEDFVRLLRMMAPDLADEMALRAQMMERIAAMAPVGRRQLAATMQLPEREVRGAAQALRDEDVIDLNASGMQLTAKGADMLPMVRAFTHAMNGLTDLEARLAQCLRVGKVFVVPGDADQDRHILQDVGRLAAQKVRAMLQNGSTLAVTGGTTMAATASHMQSPAPMNIMVVPARGGLGRSVETQANTLAAEIAQRLGGHHRLIHLPDRLDDNVRQEMMKIPEVKEALEILQRADVILHGIGRADDNARAHRLPLSAVRRLTEGGAVGEAFGYYFDKDGQCLLASSSVGVDLARLKPACQMIAVAAGRGKAQAICAVMRHYRHAVLVTDEGAARAMLALCCQDDCTPDKALAID